MLPVAVAFLLAQSDPGALAERIARGLSDPDRVSAADESAARTSSAFGPRFAVLLLDLHRCVDRGRGYPAVYRSLTRFSTDGAPAGMAEVVRGLAVRFKKAVYCGDCKDGRVPCAECKGKGRIEWLKCKVCTGEGRIRPSGAVGATDLSVKCRNCEGHGGFRNVGCAACSKTTTTPCGTCLGRPWFDRECPVGECRAGRVKCDSCRGRGRLDIPCPTCEGKGRNRASGATAASDASVKCRGCEGKGKLEEPAPCPSCDATGRVPCGSCKGDPPSGSQRRVALSSILTTSPCAPCAECAGLGIRVQPGR